MNETIKNPSLIPDWFITSGGKVTGIHDANGKEYQFVGASEKGEDGKTPDLRINSANGFKWESRYYPDDWNEIPGSPAASGMVGPQGETGPSGNSIVLQSAVPADGGVKVTLAWGENETSAFVIPSGAPGSSITAGTDLILDSGVMKVNTNGVANETGMAFVEGVDTVASGAASHAEGKETSAYGDYSHIEGYRNTEQKINGLSQANHVEGSYNNLKGVYSHLEGNANSLSGYGVHMEGAYNIFAIKNTSADKSDPEGRWNIWGQSIEGMANKTTSEPISGYDGSTPLYTHGGILKVIGNGTRTKTDDSDPTTEVITRSDALILYRDGSMWVQGPISANGVELGNANDKVDLPDSSLANMWLIYSTLSGEQQPHGWADATDVFYTKSSAQNTFLKKTLSLNIGTGNTVIDDGKCGVIGNRSTVSGNSFVVCDDNSACNNSFAFGWKVKAKSFSLAGGHGNPASQYASTIAENYSMALGDACEAYNYSQAFGRGVKFTGTANGKGALAIGGWNQTQSDALFVVGNGTGNGNRSDAMVVGVDGGVSATRFANKNGTDAVGAFSGINNVQVYPAGTSTSNFPDDGVLRIVLES